MEKAKEKAMNSYWDNNGTYQSDFDRLCELMPLSGNCDTKAGEMIRAANRLAYDFYNNGMGNNTSGAINYLSDFLPYRLVQIIKPMTNGRIYNGKYDGDVFHRAIEEMVDRTVREIMDNPEYETQENTDDIFDFQDNELEFCECCGDEMDDRGWGNMCEYCEEQEEEEYY